jgi:hypothetical protein
MEKPGEQLATKIVDRLVKEKLISPVSGKKMLPKLANGQLRSGDWRLPIESGAERKSKS